ncbi:hypothetical protein AB3G33_05275 [Flavobacterium sp. WC2421]|jgi:hypothetical protein|uniref:Uncharacterized protein n=2 Tax=unclassified Flavobacterium TaxID=196869 RepID=A0AB39WAJ4_9FLAO
MRKIKLIIGLMLFFNIFSGTLYAQTKAINTEDSLLKDSIYIANKKKVSNFSLKQFDQLFFEFSSKKGMPDFILTKKEFYNYTIQIGAFSDRLAVLYPAEKEAAEASKRKWFAESYQDYLLSKASHK